eukprot:SM000015S01238  [mRNA]  locus=s15:709253:709468:+ [translate_table: standard]
MANSWRWRLPSRRQTPMRRSARTTRTWMWRLRRTRTRRTKEMRPTTATATATARTTMATSTPPRLTRMPWLR